MAVAQTTLAAWIREERERWDVPGIAVGLLEGGRVEVAADGVAELGADEPLTPGTSFRIASVTKPFTATLVMSLVEAGLVDLDAPLGGRDGVTLRRCHSHQAGLPLELLVPLERLGDGDDALPRLAEEKLPPGLAAPGELASYSNVGYWLAGAAAARVSGTSFEDALRARVLEPLELHETAFEPVPPAATGHVQVAPGADTHRPVVRATPRARRPSGGLWSCVSDLLRFAAHHLGGPGPLSSGARSAMQGPAIDDARGSYGLGWQLRRSASGDRIVEHLGSAAGFQTILLLVPERDLALAALTNSGRGSAAIRGLVERLGLAPDEPPDVRLARDELVQFAGTYRSDTLEVCVDVEGGGLRIEAVELDPFSGDRVADPPVHARPAGSRLFVVVDDEWRGTRLDFPGPDLVRHGAVLARRVLA
jgi:CubicO group peptidase (beta-lactamase class C family)